MSQFLRVFLPTFPFGTGFNVHFVLAFYQESLATEIQMTNVAVCIVDSNKNLVLGVEQSLECRQEEAFSIHSQERIMGLLGAMIPHDANVS